MKGSCYVNDIRFVTIFWDKKYLTQNELLLDFINNFDFYGRNQSIFNRRNETISAIRRILKSKTLTSLIEDRCIFYLIFV